MRVGNSRHLELVAQRLELALEAAGVTQAEAARAIGISRHRLGNWVKGRVYPDPYLLTVLCDRYGFTTDFIYRGVVYGLPKNLADGLARARAASGGASAEASPPEPGKSDTRRAKVA